MEQQALETPLNQHLNERLHEHVSQNWVIMRVTIKVSQGSGFHAEGQTSNFGSALAYTYMEPSGISCNNFAVHNT